MNRRSALIAVGGVGLIAVIALGWYLGSPLFIDRAVDEAFPFEMPEPSRLQQMTESEKKKLEADFLSALPGESTMDELSTEASEEVTDRVMAAAAAVLSDHVMEESMPGAAVAEWVTVSQGTFAGADSFHLGSGSATVFQQADNQILRLEEFSVTNGPDLHVILTRHPAPTGRDDIGDDYLDLGSLKGNMGNQNYEIPLGTEAAEYNSVVIYCVPFHVVFATATLN